MGMFLCFVANVVNGLNYYGGMAKDYVARWLDELIKCDSLLAGMGLNGGLICAMRFDTEKEPPMQLI